MTSDPAAMFREMLGQWEAMANRYGGDALKSGEAARAMGATAGLSAQFHEATREAMTRALAAANMPSRAEITDLSARIGVIDERLQRIEAMLRSISGTPDPTVPSRPKPARSKKPAKKAKS